MQARLTFDGDAAVLTIDNPPLNLIGAAVRASLHAALAEVRDRGASRLILTGAGTTFVAGADATEFGTPPEEPHLNDVLLQLAHFPIPTIAAINGTALGGGLEIALACRYRIAAPAARLGLPEVTLGLVPGAGGTQRLPRLIGLKAALEMISTGKAVSAEDARRSGLVDRLAADPLAEALALEDAVLMAATAPDDRPAPAPDPGAVDDANALARRRMTGQTAPPLAVDLVAASATTPMPVALADERAAFLRLRGSAQSRALRHVFFAERAAARRGRDFPPPAREIASAIVVGGGNMGAAIAYAFASAGIRVAVIERDAASAERAAENLHRLVDQGVGRGKLSAHAGKALADRVTTIVGYDALPPADLAIEAAFEDFAVKQAIFAQLEAALPPDTILATNTSYLDVNLLADGLKDPSRFAGLHFFSPAHIMPLLEIVRGARTSAEVLGVAFSLARRLGKIPVISGVCDGFIGNRILARYRHAANRLLVEGATPLEVDRAMRDFGMAMGPYAAQDMSGLDIAHAAIRRRAAGSGLDPDHVPLVERLVEDHNRLGRKSGAGWYDCGADGRPVPSDLVDEEIRRVSTAMGITRRQPDAEDIVQRLTHAMHAEACDILDEGIAERPQDIDLVMIHGYGFPRWRGGLMHHAES